jgi:hypothetical protein
MFTFVTKTRAGFSTMLVIGFMAIMGVIVSALVGYVFQQARVGHAKVAREQALGAAEAGVEYMRWFLAHYPTDFQNGTGQPGPYTYVYDDPEGGPIGQAEISVTVQKYCNVVQFIDITATGTAYLDPAFKRVLQVRYAKPSISEYSYVSNTNVYAGSDRIIHGPYLSNGGIRMDGTNDSLVLSAVNSWTCTSSFGCSGSQTKPGVFGAGSGSAFWRYPVSTFDFNSIQLDFPNLKALAQAQGVYLAPQQSDTTKGYQIILKANNTADVYVASATQTVQSITPVNLTTYFPERPTITSRTFLGTYTIPASCPLVFAEGQVWLEGVVGQKETVIAAHTGGFAPDMYLNNNITYTATDGSVGLLAIAEKNMMVPLVVPSTLNISGIFVAQTGFFGRSLYACNSTYDQRTLMTINGTVVSNLRVGTKWTGSDCSGNSYSGFTTRVDSYDRPLTFSPPPFTPAASNQPKIILWREQ